MQETTEAQNLDAILQYLSFEPRVTHGPWRMNVGKLARPAKDGGAAWAGWSIAKMVWGGKRWVRASAKGFPDVQCSVVGRMVFFEVKRASTDLDPDQETFQAACEADGTPYAVVRSVDDAKAVIDDVWVWR
jgi:hypothetical protein